MVPERVSNITILTGKVTEVFGGFHARPSKDGDFETRTTERYRLLFDTSPLQPGFINLLRAR
jgi:hypothetical protein